MGFYDTPLLMYELYLRGYRVRGLAHPGHWNGPFGNFFESFGAVKASPLAAFRLLKSKEKVLLFPGGAREVVKRRGEEYQLM
jgi:1-acyl-sn-glycerol-3-phosphate acyltransferase